MHNYIAASFAQTMDNYTYEGEPIKSREGSLAQMEKMPVRPPTVADMFKHPEDHRLAQVPPSARLCVGRGCFGPCSIIKGSCTYWRHGSATEKQWRARSCCKILAH